MRQPLSVERRQSDSTFFICAYTNRFIIRIVGSPYAKTILQPMSKKTSNDQFSLCSTPNEIIMTRTFHPIGHGAFYTERFMQHHECKFSVVFDCGCYEAFKGGVPTGVFEDRIKRAIDNFYPKDKETINLLFISHFHQDHINGIKHLKDKCNIERIIVPQLTPEIVIEAYVFNYIQTKAEQEGTVATSGDFANQWIKELYRLKENPSKKSQPTIIEVAPAGENLKEEQTWNKISHTDLDSLKEGRIGQNTAIECTIVGVPLWLYIPFNLPNKGTGQLCNLPLFQSAVNGGKVDFEQLDEILKDATIKELKEAYESVYGKKHNSYSMTVFSGTECHRCFKYCHIRLLDFLRTKLCHYIPRYCTLNCLYCGDFEANPTYPKKNSNCKELKKFYDKYWDKIGLLQVPHHGSKDNLNTLLYEPEKICIISAGKTDKYQHPNMPVLQAILEKGSIPIIVTEDTRTKQEFTYHL